MLTIKNFLISGFILFNFMGMMRIHLPLDTKFFNFLYRPVDSYLSFFSIYQDWFMFAPDPAKMNFYLSAKVEFDDGSTSFYHFPRQSELTLKEKYLYGEKFRKLVTEAISKDENEWMWDDTARFVLRRMKHTHSYKIPLKVDLIRNWDVIPDMNEEFRPHLTKVQRYQTSKLYTYKVL